jgi:sarcosine oxidase subunit beta
LIDVFDAVVVGAGAVGAATSYYLAKEGLRTAVVERGDVCSGASSACDGNILVVLKEPGPMIPLTLASIDLYKELQEEIGDTFEFHQRGSTLVCEDEGDVVFCGDLMKKQLAMGLPVRWLDWSAIHEREPLLAEDVPGAIECDVDCSLNPMLATYSLARAARRLGVVFKTSCAVNAICADARGGIWSVNTDQETLAARYVINCAGAWAPFVGRMAGIDIPILPRRGHILVTESAPRVARRKVSEAKYAALKYQYGGIKVDPEVEKYGISLVAEPTDEGNMLLGSSREFAGYDARVSLEVIEAVARRARRFFPVLDRMNIIRTYAGLRPYTPDHLPIVGPVTGLPGFFIAAGHEGEGIGLAPVTGKIISAMIAGKQVDVPTEPLSPERFTKKTTVMAH